MEFKDCYQYAINLLSRRDYSQYKLTQKLKLRGFEADKIESTIEMLKEQNYLREEEYKRIRIRQLLARGYAPGFIISKCAGEHLNVTIEDIQMIQNEYQVSDQEQIEGLIRKKIRGVEIPSDFEAKQKLKGKVWRFLLSKGYKYDQCKSAVDKLI